MKVKHYDNILVGDYQFHESVSKEVQSLFAKGVKTIPKERSNVKASVHTEWDWDPDNITFRNLKEFIRREIERNYNPGKVIGGLIDPLKCVNFWGMVYHKGDYALEHDHVGSLYSFAYFVSAKWYYSPLILSDSGKRIRPKEGRYVIFPGHLKHYVPKHRYNEPRITISGNFNLTFGHS